MDFLFVKGFLTVVMKIIVALLQCKLVFDRVYYDGIASAARIKHCRAKRFQELLRFVKAQFKAEAQPYKDIARRIDPRAIDYRVKIRLIKSRFFHHIRRL